MDKNSTEIENVRDILEIAFDSLQAGTKQTHAECE